MEFMGVTSEDKCCPLLARMLMGSAHWKYVFLIRGIHLNKREKRALEGVLDAYWDRFFPDPVKKWTTSEPVSLDEFLALLKGGSVVQKIKKVVSSLLGENIE